MKLDLLLKEISDPIVKENLFRLKRELEAQQILNGYWQFYEVEFDSAGISLPIKHNLSFVPRDVILLSVEGNHNFYFLHENFDAKHVYVSCDGPCRLRFLLGSYKDKSYGGSKKDYAAVPPSGVSVGANTSWYTGVGSPSGGLGNVGDFYLETKNRFLYLKTTAYTWTFQGELSGGPREVVIPASTTQVIHSMALADFITADYLISVRNPSLSLHRTFKMSVNRLDVDIKDTISSIIGSNISYTISAGINGSNAEVVVTNNEASDLIVNFRFNKL